MNTRSRNLNKRRGKPITQEEVWACASGKACCHGRGYVEHVVPGMKPQQVTLKDPETGKETVSLMPAPTRRESCYCAVSRFDRAHPELIIDDEGHAWWPEPGQDQDIEPSPCPGGRDDAGRA